MRIEGRQFMFYQQITKITCPSNLAVVKTRVGVDVGGPFVERQCLGHAAKGNSGYI